MPMIDTNETPNFENRDFNFNFERHNLPEYRMEEGKEQLVLESLNEEKEAIQDAVYNAIGDIVELGIIKEGVFTLDYVKQQVNQINLQYTKLIKVRQILGGVINDENLSKSSINSVAIEYPQYTGILKLQKESNVEVDNLNQMDGDTEANKIFVEQVFNPLNDYFNSLQISEEYDAALFSTYESFLNIFSDVADVADIDFLEYTAVQVEDLMKKYPPVLKNVRFSPAENKIKSELSKIETGDSSDYEKIKKLLLMKLLTSLINDFQEMINRDYNSVFIDKKSGLKITEEDLSYLNRKNIRWAIAYMVKENENYLQMLVALENLKQNFPDFNIQKYSLMPSILSKAANILDIDENYTLRLYNRELNQKKLEALKNGETIQDIENTNIDTVEEFSPAKLYSKALELVQKISNKETYEESYAEALDVEEANELIIDTLLPIIHRNRNDEIHIKVYKNFKNDSLNQDERVELEEKSNFAKDIENGADYSEPYVKMRITFGEDKEEGSKPFSLTFSFSSEEIEINFESAYTHCYTESTKLNIGQQKVYEILDYYIQYLDKLVIDA